jgi:hypothetical protein
MEECAHQEVAERRAAEVAKEAEAQKEAAEQKAWLSQDTRLHEEAAEEERQQALSTGLSGLKLTIPAPSIISRLGSGSSLNQKGNGRQRRKLCPCPRKSFSVLVSICF